MPSARPKARAGCSIVYALMTSPLRPSFSLAAAAMSSAFSLAASPMAEGGWHLADPVDHRVVSRERRKDSIVTPSPRPLARGGPPAAIMPEAAACWAIQFST